MKKLDVFICLSFLLSHLSHTQEKVKLTYEFTDSDYGKDIVKVKGKILNISDQDIYFYSESCNNLDYLFSTSTDDSSIYVSLHCNITFPMKKILKAGSFFKFITHVKLKEKKVVFGLNLKFMELYKTVKATGYGRMQHFILSKDVKRTTLIRGPVISIN